MGRNYCVSDFHILNDIYLIIPFELVFGNILFDGLPCFIELAFICALCVFNVSIYGFIQESPHLYPLHAECHTSYWIHQIHCSLANQMQHFILIHHKVREHLILDACKTIKLIPASVSLVGFFPSCMRLLRMFIQLFFILKCHLTMLAFEDLVFLILLE